MTTTERWASGDARPRLRLAELVQATGVPASTIHHYRRLGLVPRPERSEHNRFAYDQRHVDALTAIRDLRERRGLSLAEIATVLPNVLRDDARGVDPAGEDEAGGDEAEPGCVDARERLLEAAVVLFRTRTFGEVTVEAVAQAAGVAKGSVYRYFASKEELFTALVEHLLADLAAAFAAAVERGVADEGWADDPRRAAGDFAWLVVRALPVLLEVGAWAAKGNEVSQDLARQVLRTLAEAAGRPLVPDAPVEAGLEVIEAAFGTVLRWALEPEWPVPRRPHAQSDEE